ncbi:MAG: response regulator transcription factor [Saprospiraceae bacterium]|nr:response regulator transcription factor [Saprospiraceae bacterium]
MIHTLPTILFVEDEPKVAAAIQQGLQENGFEVEIAPDGAVGNFLATTKKYDLILLDANLPHVSGYDVCRNVRSRDLKVPIIMLTAMQSIEKKMAGFDAGADDYIVKPYDFRELLARVKVFLRRSVYNVPMPEDTLLRIADLEMNLGTKTIHRQGMPIALTAREFALLEFLMRRNGRVASRNEISEFVWDLHFETNTNVVDVYINFLRKKIDKNFEPKLIHTKPGMGYYMKVL